MTTQSILTPVGRIVWGNPTKPRPKLDNQTNAPVLKNGVQVMQWAFGLAIPAAEFDAILWPEMYREMATKYPQGAPANFSWKFVDGAAMDTNNPPRPYAEREGYAGHKVLVVSTEAFAPSIFKFNPATGGFDVWSDVKTGDYVRVRLTFDAHTGKANTRGSVPGLYVNPQGIEFIGYGNAIISGPDAATMFGNAPRPALPPGASATPLAPAASPGMPPVPGYPPQAPGAPAAPAYAPPPPAAAPAPTLPPGMPGMPPALPNGAIPAPGMPPAPIAPGAVPPVPPAAAPPVPPTAYPSNPAGGYPGVQPHPGFVNPGGQ